MKKITQRFVPFLLVAAVFVMSIVVHISVVEAKVIDVTPITPFAEEIHYTFDNIPSRVVYCDGHTPVVKLYVNDHYYDITLDSFDNISWACCDDYGTLWLQESSDLYWTNYELEGENMIPHFFNSDIVLYTHLNCAYGYKFYSYDSNKEEIPLPTFDELKNYIKNGISVPGSKPKPSKPDPYPTVNPDNKPTTDPNHSAQPTPSTPPSDSTQKVTSSAKKVAKIKKVTTSKNTIKLINSNNKVVNKVTFNKKKSTLSYKGKKIKKVKGVWFTKKGKLLYLKKNSKAYYLNGKKSKLIKSKVLRVKTSSKFATTLKLKSGKNYKLN